MHYYGESGCSRDNCDNKAYFILKNKIYCGRCCNKNVEGRKKMPFNPMKDENRREMIEKQNDEIVRHQKINKKNKMKGRIETLKMKMMKSPEYQSGFMQVFPNFRAKSKFGWNMNSLSPMALGPVEHGQPTLPIAKNIENFHQSNKVFPFELEEEDDDEIPLEKQKVKKEFYETQSSMYSDPEPHRHKPTARAYLKDKKIKNKNKPVFSIWVDKDGREHRISYIESRQFYCTFYERLVKREEQYETLRNEVENGTNIQICGYDARNMKDDMQDYETNKKNINHMYKDESTPFGHEMVLYSILILKEEDYPWKIQREEMGFLY